MKRRDASSKWRTVKRREHARQGGVEGRVPGRLCEDARRGRGVQHLALKDRCQQAEERHLGAVIDRVALRRRDVHRRRAARVLRVHLVVLQLLLHRVPVQACECHAGAWPAAKAPPGVASRAEASRSSRRRSTAAGC